MLLNQFPKIKDACSFFTMHTYFEAYTKFNELFANTPVFYSKVSLSISIFTSTI